MKSIWVLLVTIHLFASAQNAIGYEKQTHRSLSEQAVESSVLRTDKTILENLGLKPLLYGLNDSRRAQHEQFPNYQQDQGDIFKLLGDGAEFEDNGSRATNHFYDPIRGRAASPCDSNLGYETSPDWALEDRRQLDGQDDSFVDTRKFFFDALTLQKRVDRDRAWGRTFQGLGQVIHHIQDMAQPQHVRNDLHFAYTPLPLACIGGSSFYERYTNRDDVRPRLPYDQSDSRYEPVDLTTFNVPRRYWDTEDGQGIAEYTNRGFVSAGTNFLDPRNVFSDPTVAGVREEDMTAECDRLGISRPKDSDGKPLPCLMDFVRTFVEDRYRPETSKVNARASTYSIFNDTLETYYNTKLYSLNRFNFEAGYPFLIPRAVGYSAGLINYFFRGKIDLVPDPTDPSAYLIYNNGKEELKGTFTLYYDDVNGDRRSAARWEIAIHLPDSQGVLAPNGGSMRVPTVSPYLSPAPQTPGKYLLVFHGDMGEEKLLPTSFPYVGGVAAKVVEINPLGFLTPLGQIIGAPGSYVAYVATNNLAQYGAIDWKGEGQQTISWDSYDRYFGSPYGSVIYWRGKAFVTALDGYYIVGAAINRAQNVIVAVLHRYINSEPYIEESVWSYPLFTDGIEGNPPVWTLLGTIPYDADTFFKTRKPTPWSFNSEGTEARSIYYGKDYFFEDVGSTFNGPYHNKTYVRSVTISGGISTHIVEEAETIFNRVTELVGRDYYEARTNLYYLIADASDGANASGETLIAVDYSLSQHAWVTARFTVEAERIAYYTVSHPWAESSGPWPLDWFFPLDSTFGQIFQPNYFDGHVQKSLVISGGLTIPLVTDTWHVSVYNGSYYFPSPPIDATTWDRAEASIALLDLRTSPAFVGLYHRKDIGSGGTVGFLRGLGWYPDPNTSSTSQIETAYVLTGKLQETLLSRSETVNRSSCPVGNHSFSVANLNDSSSSAMSYKFDFEENELLSWSVGGTVYNRLAGGQDPALLFPNTSSGTWLAPIGFAK